MELTTLLEITVSQKKKLYESFWDHIKVPLLRSFKMSFLKGELSTSQKQTAIKLIEKKVYKKLLTYIFT